MPLLVGRADDQRISAIAAGAEHLDFSYGQVGGTRTGVPMGFRADHHSIDLGRGHEVFELAVEGLRRWEPHRRAGARIYPVEASIASGSTVVVVLRFSFLTVVAPCRIVYITEEADRYGFAYGTLVGHPEEGEEAFHVERTEEGARFTIVAFSRPSHPLARLGRPIARRFQRATTERYLSGLKAFVAEA